MRCAVVLGGDAYTGEPAGGAQGPGPRLEFVEIAKATGADILSYNSAAAERGAPFRAVFGRYKKVGSALNAAMLASKYDRLYVTAEGVGLPLAIFLRMSGWKGRIVCVFHNMSSASKRRALALIGHNIFSAFVTVNDFQSRVLVDECGMPREKVLSVFNWVDDQFFRPAEMNPAPREPFIMACGAEHRDYETLARAASRVQGHFAVYGHGFLASNVRAQSTPDNLEYMPRVSYLQLREAYAASSLVVVPLQDVPFGAGVTGIVEAMAAGRPIIATASRGISNYLTSFDPETIVPPGDDEAMARAIVRLSGNAQARESLGRKNRLFAEDKCSVDKYAKVIAERMYAE